MPLTRVQNSRLPLHPGWGRGRFALLRWFAAAFALLGPSITPVNATLYYWDLNGSIAGAGGPSPNSTWDNASFNWSTSSAGTAAVSAVTTTTSDGVHFAAGSDASGAFTVSLSGTQSAGYLYFDTGATTLSGGTLNLAANAEIWVNSAASGMIASTITGISGLSRMNGSGTGTLTLAGNSTYDGGTIVEGGTLKVATIISVTTNVGLGTVHAASSNLGVPTTIANGTIALGSVGFFPCGQ